MPPALVSAVVVEVKGVALAWDSAAEAEAGSSEAEAETAVDLVVEKVEAMEGMAEMATFCTEATRE